MLKKVYELLIPFIKEPWKKRTFREVKKLCRKTSESYVYNSLKKYVQEGILAEEKAGNVILYSLVLSETKAQAYAGFIAEYIAWHAKHLPFEVIRKVIAKIPTPYFSFIITGSYAKNKQKEESDIDIVVVVDDRQDTKHIRAQINYACELSIPKGHPYVFTKSEFLEMLLNNEANYGKEIAMNNLLLHGASEYYSIMDEAVKNGFDYKKLSGKV
ncbi:nucleotidyltransferase domain-containing protein [Candidatus Woesearchaeota archaeon]|nr:nucleotidyltransferase domain-containing protein [Candidatus Woesearchaeota archaeon]